jgi:uncharacterized protein (DUF488 family)
LKLFTIGVFGHTSEQFFSKLTSNKIDLFIDIRRRRAVRGSKYSFVNSTELQSRLKDLNIKYLYLIDLAPTREIRELQKEEDLKNHEKKTERQKLGGVFVSEYKRQILDRYDFHKFFDDIKNAEAENVVLFCVEKFPDACHRSLVTERLHREFNIPIQHL